MPSKCIPDNYNVYMVVYVHVSGCAKILFILQFQNWATIVSLHAW